MSQPCGFCAQGDDSKQGLFHAGHNIIGAVLDHAIVGSVLDHANDLLLSGGSVGGQGAYYHADWLAEKFPTARVLSAPEYGWFGEPFSTFDDWSVARSHP